MKRKLLNNHKCKIMTVNQHLELLSEIEKMPSESISELLQIVRFFRQNQEIKNTSLNAWNDSINKLDDQSENSEEKKGKIQKLFNSWIELDDDKEQKEILEIIESLDGISI